MRRESETRSPYQYALAEKVHRAPQRRRALYMSLTVRPGGSDCFSLSAFSKSLTQSVYRYLLQRTLNLTTSFDFLIFTAAGGAASTGHTMASASEPMCAGAP